MLDKTDFASWQQRIRLYCRGKENGVNILKSIDEVPYQMGTVQETLAEGIEGAPQFGPERPRVYSDPSPEEKDRYNANIQAINILLQRLPKDIYTLINHYTDAKNIWDNVKMLLEGSELTKEDRESQLYDDFEHFQQHKGEFIHDYYVWFAKLINDMRNIKMTMFRMQLNSMFVNNMLPEWVQDGRVVVQNVQGRQNRGQGMNPQGGGAAGYGGGQTRVRNVNQGQARPDNAFDDDVDEQPVQDLALNVDNVFQADDCDAFDFDVDEALNAQTMFLANLSSANPVTDEARPSYDSDILSEVQDHDHYQDAICAHHEEHAMNDSVQLDYVVDSHADYTSDSNMILYDQYVKDNEVPIVHSNVSSVLNDDFIMIYNDMCEPHAQYVSNPSWNTVVNNSLTAKLATYKEQVELKRSQSRIHNINRNICLRSFIPYPFHNFIIMSNTNNNMQTQTSNTLHNAIMEASSKDRPPMLAPGNYILWKSRIKRYIDTKPNHELIHYCLEHPPYKLDLKDIEVPVFEGSPITTTARIHETYKNVLQEIRDQLNAKAEAVQIILTGIDNDIYSTVDACPNVCEMWKAIEKLKQGESINVQDLETNLY
nr:integrase, catalytic region, zinc finger, CCHC-type, peptidase aspartic, catalytic [Tanacetum cinerariifolium]